MKTGILGRSRSAVSGRNGLSRPFDANGFWALSSLLSRDGDPFAGLPEDER